MYTFLHNSWKAYLIFGIINLNILINMQLFAYIKVEYETRESSVPTCCKGYILEQGFYCIVFYIKIRIYTMYKCLKRLHKCKIESSI